MKTAIRNGLISKAPWCWKFVSINIDIQKIHTCYEIVEI